MNARTGRKASGRLRLAVAAWLLAGLTVGVAGSAKVSAVPGSGLLVGVDGSSPSNVMTVDPVTGVSHVVATLSSVIQVPLGMGTLDPASGTYYAFGLKPDFSGWMLNTVDVASGSVTSHDSEAVGQLGFLAVAGPSSRCDGLVVTHTGTDGNDVIIGSVRHDVIKAGAGNDLVLGLAGRDVLCGGEGNDVLLGMNGDDTIDGGSGQDTATGGQGSDACQAEKRVLCETHF